MYYRTLGKTGLQVSLLSFGTGGPSGFGQDKLERSEQYTLVHRCHELGINLFDTSPLYGQSEELLGECLVDIPRDSYYLSTKWGHAVTWSPPGVGGEDGPIKKHPSALIEGVNQSLKRLKTDYIDIIQFHGLRVEQYHEVVDRFYPVIDKLKQEGKIRFNGFTIRFIADPAHEAALLGLKQHPEIWDTVMLKYGILNQHVAKEILPLALEHNIGVLNMASVRYKLSNSDQLADLIADWKERSLIRQDSLPDKGSLDWLIHDDVDSVISGRL